MGRAYTCLTGASGGIGIATLKKLAQEKHNVVAIVRESTRDFHDFCKVLQEDNGIEIQIFEVNLEDNQAIKDFIQKLFQRKIPVSNLINCAGLAHGSILHMTSLKDIQRLIQVNVVSLIVLIQGISKIMSKNGPGSIVNISSIAARNPLRGMMLYGGTKSFIEYITKVLALELNDLSIRVNCISLGLTNTKMLDLMDPKVKNDIIQRTALKRVAEPEEIANVICFLLTLESSYINGSVISVDGAVG